MNSAPMANSTMDETAPQDTESGPKGSLVSKIGQTNIAESLSEDKLKDIGKECKEGFDVDLSSREDWEDCLDEWTNLAMQVRDVKSYPWPNASNVKYPLLSTASMQFNARAYPSLVPSDGKIVKGRVLGKDLDGSKGDKADRIATYMSYQFMHEMDCWDEDMDKMLLMLPIIGTVFKKTYWDKSKEAIASVLVLPKNLVVNNWSKSLETSERISEVIEMSQRVFKERKRQGIFLDVDLGEPTNDSNNKEHNSFTKIDETTPYVFVEQHRFLDLDDDGYEEPYTVTFHKQTGTVLRILARFEPDGIETDDEGKITKIEPVQYYTKFSFVPNPSGCFYDIGFGILLGPINEAVNTLINQQVDSGTLSNMQSGFIGKGLKLKAGDTRFQPGEWKSVATSGQDLKSQIVPLPAKEPSNVLFQLMTALITSGKELASVAEIFVGKMPGQNTPATTTMATIEQGMKVFTAVYKRIYRALDKEFKKVYRLNEVYLNPETYAEVLDAPVGPDDFDSKNYDVCPGADPTAMSSTEKLLKAQGLLELLPTGVLDPIEVISRVLQAQEQPNWEKLFTQQVQQTGQPPAPPPDPKMLELQMKSQMDQQKGAQQQQQQAFSQAMDQRDQQFKMAMESQKQDNDQRHAAVMQAIQTGAQYHMDQARVQGERMKVQQQAVAGQQKLQQNHEAHQQKLQQMKETSKLQAKTSTTGSSKK